MIESLLPCLFGNSSKLKPCGRLFKETTTVSSDDIEKILFRPIDGNFPYRLKKVTRKMNPLENVRGLMYINGDYYNYEYETGF